MVAVASRRSSTSSSFLRRLGSPPRSPAPRRRPSSASPSRASERVWFHSRSLFDLAVSSHIALRDSGSYVPRLALLFSRLRCEIRRLPKSGGTDAEQNWFSFKTEFMKAQSSCIPQRKITPNGTKQPEWFNKSIAEAISNRLKAYNISKLRPSPESKVAHIRVQECRQAHQEGKTE